MKKEYLCKAKHLGDVRLVRRTGGGKDVKIQLKIRKYSQEV